MADRSTYSDYLKQDLGQIIDGLPLREEFKRYMRSRWLDQILWMENRAGRESRWYFALRLVTIVGSVIIPALIGLKLEGRADGVIRLITFSLSLTVAISAAVEEFFHFGDRWRHYRQTVEQLKIEGWHFFPLCGSYRRYKTHDEGYPSFAARVEGIIQPSIESFIGQVTQEKEETKEKETRPAGIHVPER